MRRQFLPLTVNVCYVMWVYVKDFFLLDLCHICLCSLSSPSVLPTSEAHLHCFALFFFTFSLLPLLPSLSFSVSVCFSSSSSALFLPSSPSKFIPPRLDRWSFKLSRHFFVFHFSFAKSTKKDTILMPGMRVIFIFFFFWPSENPGKNIP